jgi:tRNA (guanosine-2'-O-)-methyltransferase
MGGGGKHYEASGRMPPEPSELLLAPRKERIAQVVAQRTRSLSVVLDRLEDTFNMAAVLRTCEGMGVQDIHIIENPEVPFEPNRKVTQGCDKWLTLNVYPDARSCFERLKAGGYKIWVSAARQGAVSLTELRFDGKVALVFGNERTGVSEEVLANADGVFWIPMRGFTQSFNISVAVSACVTRAVFWREEHGHVRGDLEPLEARQLEERFFGLAVKQRKRIYRAQH